MSHSAATYLLRLFNNKSQETQYRIGIDIGYRQGKSILEQHTSGHTSDHELTSDTTYSHISGDHNNTTTLAEYPSLHSHTPRAPFKRQHWTRVHYWASIWIYLINNIISLWHLTPSPHPFLSPSFHTFSPRFPPLPYFSSAFVEFVWFCLILKYQVWRGKRPENRPKPWNFSELFTDVDRVDHVGVYTQEKSGERRLEKLWDYQTKLKKEGSWKIDRKREF